MKDKEQPNAAPRPKDIGDVPGASEDRTDEDKKLCHICGKPYDDCDPGHRFRYVIVEGGDLAMIYFCGLDCYREYLRKKHVESMTTQEHTP